MADYEINYKTALTVPTRRKTGPNIYKVLIGLGGIAVSWIFQRNQDSIISQVIYSSSILLSYELIERLCYFREEMTHLETRYNNDYKKCINRVIGEQSLIYCFIFAVLSSLYCFKNFNTPTLWMPFIMRFIISELPKIEKNHLIILRKVGLKHSGLFYGFNMASSFYHGYLNIILPDHGRPSDSSFRERLNNYIDANRYKDEEIEIPDKRLHILIPASGESGTNVAENSDWIEMRKNVKAVIITRGGVQERVYHNTIYRIKDPKDQKAKAVYIAAEFATPLITFLEACKHTTSGPYWDKCKRDTIISFYESCKDIVYSDSKCREQVKFVYYQDKINGKKFDIGPMLLESIRQDKED